MSVEAKECVYWEPLDETFQKLTHPKTHIALLSLNFPSLAPFRESREGALEYQMLTNHPGGNKRHNTRAGRGGPAEDCTSLDFSNKNGSSSDKALQR